VYVSGTLGDAALALAALSGQTTMAADALVTLRQRLERPEPRVALGERLREVATAAIDVSDGLTGDLAHILAASSVGADVELARIPRSPLIAQRLATHDERKLALACLLAGGDDYELCFTAPPAARERVAAIARELSLPLTRIGIVTSSPGLHVRDEHGAALASLPAAFDHFR
jgi:thiamine-monophosphate kinase